MATLTAADWLLAQWASPDAYGWGKPPAERDRSYAVRCALRDLMLACKGMKHLHGV